MELIYKYTYAPYLLLLLIISSQTSKIWRKNFQFYLMRFGTKTTKKIHFQRFFEWKRSLNVLLKNGTNKFIWVLNRSIQAKLKWQHSSQLSKTGLLTPLLIMIGHYENLKRTTTFFIAITVYFVVQYTFFQGKWKNFSLQKSDQLNKYKLCNL